ncbi:MAG: MutS-related protein [Myxococcales bacterium]
MLDSPAMISDSSPLTEYRRRAERCRQALARLDRWSLALANTRLALFLGALALVGLGWWGKLPAAALWAALGLGLGFLAAAVLHDRVISAGQLSRHRLAINERGIARLEDRWADLPHLGEAYDDPSHPYARDLDLFGRSSLFQLLDATTTRWGEARLAAWLCEGAPVGEITSRQQAVAELAPLVELRETFEAEGRMLAETKSDPSRMLAWAESSRLARLARVSRWLPFTLPPVTFLLYLAGDLGLLPARLWLAGLGAQAAIAFFASRIAGSLHRALNAPGERFAAFGRVFAVIERARFSSKPLADLKARLAASGAPPSVEMNRLVRALSFIHLREQPLFHVPINVLLLWDLGWAGAVERWRERCGPRLRAWLGALADIEALSSLAGFSFDNPGYLFPEVRDGGEMFVAEGLGHPLLPASRRVCNDVALPSPGTALVVTGSNMAGKTTLLRTIGINAVLALAGAPVCARRLSLRPLAVRTSMRVQDSLARGLSYFYAEIERLKCVLEACDQGPVLFLLDEVMQGTNTAERQIASRAIVRRLVERGAVGAIATHDLALTTLEQETGGLVRNVHFTDRVEDGEMSFDYTLRSGVVATTNALALLKKAGIDLPEASLRRAGSAAGVSDE